MRTVEEPVERLRRYLNERGPGGEEFRSFVAEAWPDLLGAGMTALASRKLGRIEDVTWSDPVLTFTIERHGAIVAGSSARAEVQTWEANLASCTAKVTSTTHRQLSPMAARFDAQRAALEIAELVEQGKDDARLEWASDRSSVRVLISTIPELSTGYKETLTGRRRRFSRALEKALSELGWAPARQPYQYRREADAGEC